MTTFLTVLAALFVVCVVLGVYAAVRTKRAVQRQLEERVPQVRKAAEDMALKTRSATRPGAAGNVAELRLTVRNSLESTRGVLRQGASEDSQLTEALALCQRMEEQGRELDEELRVLEREPAKPRVQEKLPQLRERADRITHSSDALRWAAQDRMRRSSDDDLTQLTRDVEMEAGALRHWTPTSETEAAPQPDAVSAQESKRRKRLR